jgi:transcriptional regulator with XRE-family HTH domain
MMNPENIKQIRAELGWSQSTLAHHLGYTAPTIMKWEKGITPPPDVVKGVLLKLDSQLDQKKKREKEEFIKGFGTLALTGGIVGFLTYIFNENDE